MADRFGHLRFILYLPTISKSGKFNLRDLPGSGRRIDVLCRSLAACFEWGPSAWPHSNLEVVALFEDNTCLRFEYPGPDLPAGEVGWAEAIQNALEGNPPSFITAENLNLKGLVAREQADDQRNLWALEETAIPLNQGTAIDPVAQNSFLIGNHRGFDAEALKVIDDHSIYRVSLGRISYLTSHCVVAILSHMEEMIH